MAKFDKPTSEKGFENQLESPKRGLTRRDFFKITAAAGAGGGVASMLDWAMVGPTAGAYDVNNVTKTISVCPYCAVGCNVTVAKDNISGQVVDIYGDTVCPINRGGLCSKGAAALQLVNNTQRVGVAGSVLAQSAPPNEGPVRRVGNSAWTAITWDTALTEIASAVVATRAATGSWIDGGTGKVNNVAHGVAFLGSAHATNEENWLYRKLVSEFGTNDIEHQARI